MTFTCDAYLKTLDKNQLSAFRNIVMFDIPEESKSGWSKFFDDQPKVAVGLAVMRIVSAVVVEIWKLQSEHKERALDVKAGKALFEEMFKEDDAEAGDR